MLLALAHTTLRLPRWGWFSVSCSLLLGIPGPARPPALQPKATATLCSTLTQTVTQ